jgi:mRNA-degrading endonuclease toxin of MazEF toxin-antitoxin module
VLACAERFAGGTLEFDVAGDAGGGYVLGRAFGEHDSPSESRQQKIRHCALTNPVYVDTAQTTRLAAAATRLVVVAGAGSQARGASFRVLSAGGESLETGALRAERTELRVPASARLELAMPDGRLRDIPVAMANARLRAHIEYLAEGLFLQDWPSCSSGDVPVEAFRFEAVREALAETTLAL